MPKESNYINKKSLVLFDLYAELDIAKRSKAYKDGNTETVCGMLVALRSSRVNNNPHPHPPAPALLS